MQLVNWCIGPKAPMHVIHWVFSLSFYSCLCLAILQENRIQVLGFGSTCVILVFEGPNLYQFRKNSKDILEQLHILVANDLSVISKFDLVLNVLIYLFFGKPYSFFLHFFQKPLSFDSLLSIPLFISWAHDFSANGHNSVYFPYYSTDPLSPRRSLLSDFIVFEEH